MNYKKMRAILIAMLVFTNAIMGIRLMSTYINDVEILKKMTENNILHLKNRGIYIDEEKLTIDYQNTGRFTYSAISQKNIELLIENVTSSENNLFIGENGTAKIDDGAFAITLNQSHTRESIEELLTLAEFNLSNTFAQEYEGVIKYTLKFNENLVSNCFFEVILSSDTTTIAGTFVFSQPHITPSENEFSVFFALVKLCEYYNIEGEVESMSFDYMMSESDYENILPIFKVVIDGKEYKYDIFSNDVV